MSHNNQTVRIISVSPTVNLLEVFLGRDAETAELSFANSRACYARQGDRALSRNDARPSSLANLYGILESRARLAVRASSIQVILDTPSDQAGFINRCGSNFNSTFVETGDIFLSVADLEIYKNERQSPISAHTYFK